VRVNRVTWYKINVAQKSQCKPLELEFYFIMQSVDRLDSDNVIACILNVHQERLFIHLLIADNKVHKKI